MGSFDGLAALQRSRHAKQAAARDATANAHLATIARALTTPAEAARAESYQQGYDAGWRAAWESVQATLRAHGLVIVPNEDGHPSVRQSIGGPPRG